jgi:hypothetical protein
MISLILKRTLKEDYSILSTLRIKRRLKKSLIDGERKVLLVKSITLLYSFNEVISASKPLKLPLRTQRTSA